MTLHPLRQRPVRVGGIGLHRYQRRSGTSYAELGVTAVRAALDDAGIRWTDVDAAVVGSALLGMAPGRVMLARLGATGLSIHQVENASASGSTAVAQAVLIVASGLHDVVVAVGVDTPEPWHVAPAQAGIGSLEGGSGGAVHALRVAGLALPARVRRHRRAARPGRREEPPQRRHQPVRPAPTGAHARQDPRAARSPDRSPGCTLPSQVKSQRP